MSLLPGFALPPPPVVLGIVLNIPSHKGPHHAAHPEAGRTSWGSLLRVDPSLELVFLCETVLPGLPALARPDVVAATLRAACLTWEPDPSQPPGQDGCSLTALEDGHCFLAADANKIPIAAFSRRNIQPTYVAMEQQGQPNLLEYLRAEWFTLEISGTNHQYLTHSLTFKAELEFEVELLS